MKPVSSMRIGMVGMYGGMWREFNPGCFLIAHKTKQELQKRLPSATIDIFSIDNKSQKDLPNTVSVGGLDLTFFGSDEQHAFLDATIGKYDALIMGGDIIWGGDDVVQDNDIFFLNTPRFLASKTPRVAFNSVHTFYDDETIVPQRDMFRKAHERAVYTAVRTHAVRNRLKQNALQGVRYTPDPVLDLDMQTLPSSEPLLTVPRDKPVLGISVRKKLAADTIQALKKIDLSAYTVVILPFSKQYDNLGALHEIREQFGDAFYYFDHYVDPVKTYQLVGELDVFLNDTYHGNIAAIIQRKPFISLDVEPELTSRKQQLLDITGIDQRYNVRLEIGNPQNSATLTREIPALLATPLSYDPHAMHNVHTLIQRHFDAMAAAISGASAVAPTLEREKVIA